MKQDLKNDWIQKIVRVRNDYINLSAYLEFFAKKNNIERHIFFNDVFKYSLSVLKEKGMIYDIDEYKPRRIPKGFLIEKNVNDDFLSMHKELKKQFNYKYARKLYVCELVELILYIYAIDNLSYSDLASVNIVDWGIKKLI